MHAYRTICNDLRRDLARGLMKAGKNNKTQIAGMLGYTDAGSFTKAMRVWERQ